MLPFSNPPPYFISASWKVKVLPFAIGYALGCGGALAAPLAAVRGKVLQTNVESLRMCFRGTRLVKLGSCKTITLAHCMNLVISIFCMCMTWTASRKHRPWATLWVERYPGVRMFESLLAEPEGDHITP